MTSSFIETSKVVVPAVPLRDMVVFPHMMAPFIVGRESSVRALEIALTTPGKRLYLVAQADPKVDEPQRTDLKDMEKSRRVAKRWLARDPRRSPLAARPTRPDRPDRAPRAAQRAPRGRRAQMAMLEDRLASMKAEMADMMSQLERLRKEDRAERRERGNRLKL